MSIFKAFNMKAEQLLLPLPFPDDSPPKPQTLAEFLELSKAMEEEYQRKMRAFIDTSRAKIENEGFQIINLGAESDDPPIEADFGAPALGLSLAKKIFNIRDAFRYTPVEYVDRSPFTYMQESLIIGQTLKEQGYTLFEKAKEEDYKSYIHFANGGVTKAFNDTISTIVDEFKKIQDLRKKIAPEQRGVILAPVPTYGLFLDAIERIGHDRNIVVMPVKRSDNGSVDINSLKTQIKVCGINGDKILAYFDNSPLNPTGHIRTKAETQEVARIIDAASNEQTEREFHFYQSRMKKIERKLGPEAYKSILSYYADTPMSSIFIIDDMAYEGLEMNAKRKSFSFGQCNVETARMAVVLKGISKIGMPGLRIGMLIAHPHIAAYLTKHQVTKEFSANSMGVDVMSTRYGNQKQRGMFKRHEKKLRENHLSAAQRVQVFFKGLDNVPDLSEEKRWRTIWEYAVHNRIATGESESILKKGLPNFHIAGVPQSGFFQCVNCEALKGRAFAMAAKGNDFVPHMYEISGGDNLYWIFRAFKIKAVVGNAMGLSDNSLMARISFSLPEKDMFTLYDRLRDMHEYFWGKNPQVQLDIFRHTKPQVVALAP